ncbi:MAG: hypothetical protein M1838_000538 [Thelocarpon superellum]|nr:MAG: hypothetical protein M1838_000538 [Thelocarpon superellum]
MASTAPPKVGLIIGSQRVPRAGLQISEFVFQTIQRTNPSVTLSVIDLATWNLPICNEPGVPQQITDPELYTHDHTKRWSAEISSCSAFVFVTPQYNWGYPASLKNAIDYLFHEWKGKPGMIVGYGGHGGVKAVAQLKEVLGGLRMRPVEKTVGLAFPDRGYMGKAASGADLELSAESDEGVWAKERGEIVQAFEELVGLMKA